MIDAACRQSSYLLPLLTNAGSNSNKMKRNTTNDNDDDLTYTPGSGMMRVDNHKKLSPPRKKLKFGVDAILGTNSDNESSHDADNNSDDEIRHKSEYLFFHRIIITVEKHWSEQRFCCSMLVEYSILIDYHVQEMTIAITRIVLK